MCRLLPLVLVMLSCYQPSYPSGQFACGQPGQSCPEGQVCVRDLCIDPGVQDLSTPPASSPDMRFAPCAAGWVSVVGSKIYACKESFTVTAGSYAGLCPSGYHVCDMMDDLSKIDDAGGAACNGAGIFITQMDIALMNQNGGAFTADGVCMPMPAQGDRALVGCGMESGMFTLNNDCGHAKSAIACATPPSGWTCTSAQEVHHASTDGGVLCCHD